MLIEKDQPSMSRLIATAAGFLILIFPALLMTVPLAGGGALFFLIIVSCIGLYHHREVVPLSQSERHLIFAVLFFFAVYVVNIISFETRLSGLDDVSRFIILLPVFFYLRKANVRVEYFLFSIIAGAISCGVFGFYQIYYLELPRAEGIKNAVPFGGISIVLGLMCLSGVLLSSISKPFRFLLLIGFLMGLAGSIFSGTRGGWIAIPVAVLMIIAMNPMQWGKKKKLASIAILFLGLGSAYYLPDVQMRVDTALHQFNAYFSEGVVGTSVGLRLEAWRASVLAISENLFFGVGEGNFRNTMKILVGEGRANELVVEKIAHVHNEFIAATLHRGLIGFVSLILIFIVPLYAFMKLINKGRGLNPFFPMSGVILVTGYMVFALTDIVFGHQNTTLLYVAYLYVIFGMMSSNLRAPST